MSEQKPIRVQQIDRPELPEAYANHLTMIAVEAPGLVRVELASDVMLPPEPGVRTETAVIRRPSSRFAMPVQLATELHTKLAHIIELAKKGAPPPPTKQ